MFVVLGTLEGEWKVLSAVWDNYITTFQYQKEHIVIAYLSVSCV